MYKQQQDSRIGELLRLESVVSHPVVVRLMHSLTDRARDAVGAAAGIATLADCVQVEPVHLLLAVDGTWGDESPVRAAISASGLRPDLSAAQDVRSAPFGDSAK